MAGELIKAGEILKIGQRVEFYVGDDDEKYTSRIEDMTKTELMVAMPMNKQGVPVIPMSGERLYALAAGETCRYRFFTKYLGSARVDGGNFSVWKIAIPEEVERHQNRQFVRVRVNQRVQVRVIDEEGQIKDPQMTQSVDLSGNGLCFISRNPIRIGNKVALEIFDIPDVGVLEVMSHVVRCTEVETGSGVRLYHVGVGFEQLSRTTVNKVVRYLFTVQRRSIAKGIEL